MTYDEQTQERLTWAHGPVRASIIIQWRDAATKADLDAWRRLGEVKGSQENDLDDGGPL